MNSINAQRLQMQPMLPSRRPLWIAHSNLPVRRLPSRYPLSDSSYKDIPGSFGGLNVRAILASLENSKLAAATAAIVSPPEPHMFTENDVLSFHRTNLGRRNLTSLTT
ncbi:hypothetical protein GJ496_009613 [Pomphorhynchus laevis]|nr:hypothetical protein GJ496_009613 [Pomphorhynchus laevis]